ncbi:MAG TPA: transglycosylase family protein [Candidatus Microsaccharimonas sp.]|nr:transglycosylase family protein [Candidatus Microsaccharimonas sp.]
MRLATTAAAVGGALLLSVANSQVAPTATASAATSSTKAKVKIVAATQVTTPPPQVVTVQPGDYLYKISGDTNTSVQRIYDANTSIDNPDLIFPGQQLTIPDEKAAIAHRDMPATSAVAQEVQAEAAGSTSSYSAPAPSDAPAVAGGSVWDQLAQCESGGNWAINTGNGFYGGLQFTLSSWQAVGGSGYPNQASREEQILRGQMLQARGGWGNWPACSAKLGLY